MTVVPALSVQITGAVLWLAVAVAKEVQVRHRRNGFLDRVNEDLFMPRGLFAVVMTFKDDNAIQNTGSVNQG